MTIDTWELCKDCNLTAVKKRKKWQYKAALRALSDEQLLQMVKTLTSIKVCHSKYLLNFWLLRGAVREHLDKHWRKLKRVYCKLYPYCFYNFVVHLIDPTSSEEDPSEYNLWGLYSANEFIAINCSKDCHTEWAIRGLNDKELLRIVKILYSIGQCPARYYYNFRPLRSQIRKHLVNNWKHLRQLLSILFPRCGY